MNGNFAIMHDIPGRLRIIIPPLGDNKDYEKMEEMFASLSGVKKVRIEPIIRSMLIEYDLELMERKVLLGYISLFFEKTWCDPIDNLMGKVTPSIRKDLFRSVISGFLLLLSFERKGLVHTIKREFGTGLMLGLICAIVLMIVVPFLYQSYMLAFIVGISLFLTLSIATIIGAVVPVIITKLKLDPAIASGPFITTVNDILGLLIYFSIATALIDYLPT